MVPNGQPKLRDHSLSILFESNQFLLLNKEPGLNVEQLHDYPSVEARVDQYLQQKGIRKPYVGIVHRLDRPVSGVLLVAKKKQTLKQLNEQFRNRRVQKTYFAIVEGAVPQPSDQLMHYLRRRPDRRTAEIVDKGFSGSVACRLQYRLLHYDTKRNYSLLEVQPFQGRFHQIRVQLAALGTPIVGDTTYGAKSVGKSPLIALHAYRLTFTNPHTEERQTQVAPLQTNRLFTGLDDLLVATN